MMLEKIKYCEFNDWHIGSYIDKKKPCSAAREFCFLNENKTDECFLVVHGFSGYPGEMITPAYEAFKCGYDVFVPRLPGHGTSKDDFIASNSTDWLNVIKNAISDLSNRYSKVNLMGHSMGGCISAILGCNSPTINKIIYIAPAFKIGYLNDDEYNKYLKLSKEVNCYLNNEENMDPLYHPHYENAPCDLEFFWNEYGQYDFPKQLLELHKLMKLSYETIKEYKREALFINPLDDVDISVASANYYKTLNIENSKIVDIENGTHCVQYDINEKAERDALSAIREYLK